MFRRLNPKELPACFLRWLESTANVGDGERHIAIDGKSLRRSFDRPGGRALHVVSAFATGELSLGLGQVAVDDKSHEINAIPELLRLLDLQGAVVTIDAMGCHKAIAAQIASQGGDYLLALKGNHPLLHADAQRLFADQATAQGDAPGAGRDHRKGPRAHRNAPLHGPCPPRRSLVACAGWPPGRECKAWPAWKAAANLPLAEPKAWSGATS